MVSESIAYSDGAFSSATGRIGSGVVLNATNPTIDGIKLPWIALESSVQLNTRNIVACNPDNGKFSKKETEKTVATYVKYGALIGEILAARHAIYSAVFLNTPSIILNYDFEGVEYFSAFYNLSEKQKREIPYLKEYAELCEIVKMYRALYFAKVKAHSGNKLNQRADQLARGVNVK
jgi:ribonuclease HI